jgi:serine/threonine protein kinase
MCTEFVHESFAAWYKRLETRSAHDKCLDIRIKFSQVLTGLLYVHRQGIMHRNLKPDNIFIDSDGVIKLGDFTTTRMLDIPIQAYTPEDPKERDRSGREMRRLWYRAPELILRDEVYGPKVDTWSVGCLLAEAATGRSLFQSDSEIDHLFRVFRLLGTPTNETWPEVVTMRNFSPKFPIYPGIKLSEVTRAVCLGNEADLDSLMNQAQPDRTDVLQNLLSVAAVLGADGMMVLDQLIMVPPSARAGAGEILDERFFRSHRLRALGGGLGASQDGLGDGDLRVSNWLHGRPLRALARDQLRPDACMRCELSSEMKIEESGGEDVPPISLPSNLASSEMVWSIMNVMRQNEKQTATDTGYSESVEGTVGNVLGHRRKSLPRMPHGFDANQRAKLVDFIIGLASTLSLTDYTLHLAVGLLNKYLATQDECLAQEQMQVAGATCLKVADVFAEQSKEYYKQENASEYAEATLQQALPEQMLAFEKTLLPKLEFDLHLPTTHWFVHCYLAYGRFNPLGSTAKTAFFIGDLTLLDYDLLAYAPSLRAQCAVLLAVFLVQQAQSQKQRRSDGTFWINASQDHASSSQPASSRASSQAGQPQPGDGEKQVMLTYFEHWDTVIRNQVCQGNTSIDTALCLQAIVRTLVVLRREWKSAQLTAVEAKHASIVRTLVYPERFPVSKLVRYILPDSQRGLVPE